VDKSQVRLASLAGLAAGATGILCLVLPFTAGISPLAGLRLAFGLEGDTLTLISITAPALLAIPIAAWQVRRIYVPVPAPLEMALAYALAGACLLLIIPASVFVIGDGGLDSVLRRFAALAVCWFAVIGVVGLLIRNRARSVPPGIGAEVFLLLAYLPNALLCLVLFAYWEFVFGPTWMWDSGAWLMIVTCVLLVTSALLRLRGLDAPGRVDCGHSIH
jgi:hypothetical protein